MRIVLVSALLALTYAIGVESLTELKTEIQAEVRGRSQKKGKGKGKKKCKPKHIKKVDLMDFETWKREEGYWVGEYTFLGADGDPYESSTWPYPYDHYMGFIHLAIDGPNLSQRNVFLYPP
jgi:hypothetical protein